MKKIKIILITTIVSFFSSCNMSDSIEELPGDYTFVHEGEDYNFISGKKNILPNVIDYEYDESFILACQEPNRIMYKSLFGSNLSFDYTIFNKYLKDSTTVKYYKSRKEILGDSTIAKIFKNKNVSFENTSEDIKKGEEIADSIIKNNPIHKKIFSLKKVYWIIQIKDNILFGPYSKQEYLIKRKIIKVDERLALKH